METPLDDFVVLSLDCDCEFTPYDNDPDEDSWHYKRRCYHCGETWYSLHCPHDGFQNPCPACGGRTPPKE